MKTLLAALYAAFLLSLGASPAQAQAPLGPVPWSALPDCHAANQSLNYTLSTAVIACVTGSSVTTALPSATTSQLYGGTGTAGVAAPFTMGSGLSCASSICTTLFPVEAAKTSGYTLAAIDMGYTVPLNISGGGTLTIPSSGFGTTVLGPGQSVCVQNINTSPDPITNSSPGAPGNMYPQFTSIPPGQSLCLQGDGTNMYALMTVALAPVSTPVVLTDGTTIAVNGALSNNFTLALGASGHTLSNPTNTLAGQWISFLIAQPSSGGPYTMAFGSNYQTPSGTTLIVSLNQAASSVTNVACQVIVAAGAMQCYAPVTAAFTQSQPSNPTAPASTASYFMQGLAGTFTPQVTGSVTIDISGTVVAPAGTAAGIGIIYQLSYGTGTAPSNAGALAGTQIGKPQTSENDATVTAADVQRPFHIAAHVTGLNAGTAYWIDLAAKSIGTASDMGFQNLNVMAAEQGR